MLADVIGGETIPVCAVEIEKYPQSVLALRFPDLAIWDDVCTFRADNPETAPIFDDLRSVANSLVIAGGFPCQDISCAGRGAGLRGERSGLWREYARIVREIRPAFVFVENSPMLVQRGLGDVLGDLAALRYDAAWGIVSAADMGAMHLRERFWLTARRMADADGSRE